jgi:hypothetical protein
MPRHVAVVFVHGILGENISFAEIMRQGLVALLPKELRGYVTFESVSWADLVRGRQRNFLQKARASADIADSRLRRFLIEGLGDAAAYQKTRHRENSIYHNVQSRIGETLAYLDAPGREDRPLIFIGHSLGCHIISSYVWDLNQLKQLTEAEALAEPEVKELWLKLQNATAFRRLDTFAGFVTLGNNMPLFTFTFGPERVYPITSAPPDPTGRGLKPAFPGSALARPLLEQARWLNFFSKRDLLGYPLKSLNAAYQEEGRIQDICVRSESLRSRTIPYLSFLSAHTGYWTNRTVLSETASLIRDIVG